MRMGKKKENRVQRIVEEFIKLLKGNLRSKKNKIHLNFRKGDMVTHYKISLEINGYKSEYLTIIKETDSDYIICECVYNMDDRVNVPYISVVEGNFTVELLVGFMRKEIDDRMSYIVREYEGMINDLEEGNRLLEE
jgi:hypothetical protein